MCFCMNLSKSEEELNDCSVCAMNQRTASLLCRLKNVFRLQAMNNVCMNECSTNFLIIALFAILSAGIYNIASKYDATSISIRQENVLELHEKQSNFMYLREIFYL